jgi:hypothetical protein
MSENTLLSPSNLQTADEYNRNFRWFMNNYEKVRNANRRKFIAVYNEQVFSDINHNDLLSKLREHGITNIDSVFQTYVPEGDDLLL